MKTMIEIPEGKKAEWKNGVLTLVDDSSKSQKQGNIMDRIKTYEDACKELGRTPGDDIEFTYQGSQIIDKDILAYLKMRTIVEALNEGWEPQFTKDEYRWYPWYDLYTKQEIEEMDTDKRESVVLWGGVANYGANCGLAYASSSYGWSIAIAGVGSRLALKSEELAVYFGKQFAELIADFIFVPDGNYKKFEEE